MSHYLFGFYLDGAPARHDQQGLQSSIGGPETLLSALETSLGLPPLVPQALERTLAYRDLIATALTDDSFHARSFRCAPLATARLLLSWRDNLREAGWHANLDHHDAPARLRVLAAFESAFLASGLAETTHTGRIAAILSELEGGSQPAIDSLTVIDPPDTLPRCWTKLFAALHASYDDPGPVTTFAELTSTLGSVQASFLGHKTACIDDRNTVRIVTASTAEAAADALACQLARLSPASTTTVIAGPSDRETLRHPLQRLDLPVPTAKRETAAALLELPCLVLRCRLGPLDPQAWIEFLLHSISPIPSRLRHRLAETIHDLPGRGPHWEEALESCISHADDEEAIGRLRKAYADWVDVPLIALDSLTGAAIADAISPLAQWLAQRAGTKKSDESTDATEWGIASRAVAQLEALFRSEGAITRGEIDKLLFEWRQHASATSRFPGEVGSVTVVASAAQLLAPQDHVIWWRPAPTHIRRAPWTCHELDWLASHGITFPDESSIALAAEASAIRAALLARQSLTLYHVTQSAGGPAEQAGILTRLLTLCGPSVMVAARTVTATEAIPLRPLPQLRRWWNLPQPGMLPVRPQESFSSISKVIDSPVDWVLDYHAKLSFGPIAGFRVNDDALRTGSILHAAAELIFTRSPLNWQTTSEQELHQFFAESFSELLADKSAHYLTIGREAARARLLSSAKQGLWRLIGILREAEVTEVTLETTIGAHPFVGGQIGGRIDLIARRADGRTAVIDLKLGGKTKRREELQNNRHLQLATYGHLMRQSEGIEPATAFFIFSNGGELLTRDDHFFPNISRIPPKRDTPTSDWQACWQEFEQIYQWRRRQLDQGRIEVPVSCAETDDPSPIERWAPPKGGNPYSFYRNLTGHPANA